ncbi:MAG: signal peptidase II [Bradyrhizobiaceae bacterium]|nr:signal peptidase II [Bradyrhizobiaceae bacterium]
MLNRSNAFGSFRSKVSLALGAHRLELCGSVILLRFVLRQSTSTLIPVISAGALGNFLDRLRLGAVVDLFDASKLGFVWVFNVADVSIDFGISKV